jgi:hypothetical protein
MSSANNPPVTAPTAQPPAAVQAADVPANEYERFLAALPESLREECRTRLTGSNLSPDHPIFQLLADFYEKNGPQKPVDRDFLGEATLHADRAKQLLTEFNGLPDAILGKIEPQLHGLLLAFAGPVERVETAATHLQRNVEALPVLLLARRFKPDPMPSEKWRRPWWFVSNLLRAAWSTASDHLAWIVTGSISLCAAIIVLALGASHLSRAYEASYQQRLAHLEADSVQNTIALNRLLTAGITLKVERDKDGDAYFLILQGAHKAAEPVNSPEGLAVEIWP